MFHNRKALKRIYFARIIQSIYFGQIVEEFDFGKRSWFVARLQ